LLALPHYSHLVDGLPRAGERKPLLLFLHGKGERGQNLKAVRAHGPPQLYPRHGLDRFIVLSPQCPAEEKWDAGKLDEFLSAFCQGSPVDPSRIYLTGLSLGGEGGWNLLRLRPERFAASVLICGRVAPETTRGLTLRLNPIWLIHSAADDAVPVSHSDTLFAELKAIGAPVTYTRYDSFGHVKTWQEAYRGTRLYDWLLQYPERS
jgi:predicted peptidase